MNAYPVETLLDDSLLIACSCHDPTLETYLHFEEYKVEYGEELPIQAFVCASTVDWEKFAECLYQYNHQRREYRREVRKFVPRKKAGGKKILELQRACEFCGQTFKPKLARDRFCSMSCSAKRFERLPNVCVICGTHFKKEFTRSSHKYCSDDCRNKGKTSVVIEFDGNKHSLNEWAQITGIDADQLRRRRSAKWPIEKMLTTPVKKYKTRSA